QTIGAAGDSGAEHIPHGVAWESTQCELFLIPEERARRCAEGRAFTDGDRCERSRRNRACLRRLRQGWGARGDRLRRRCFLRGAPENCRTRARTACGNNVSAARICGRRRANELWREPCRFLPPLGLVC